MPLLKNKEHYTYAEYLTWPDDERWEIIGGIAYAMTPAPGVWHQQIVISLARILGFYLLRHRCRLMVSPLDVVLSEEDVVQPDVFVVCDPQKIKDTHIDGAPDLIFEILSPSTSLKDRREKKHLYEEHGVKEYILLDPLAFTAERFVLSQEGTYGTGILYGQEETLPLETIDFPLVLADVFNIPGREKNHASPQK
jgi:Uma2 family endonuclease